MGDWVSWIFWLLVRLGLPNSLALERDQVSIIIKSMLSLQYFDSEWDLVSQIVWQLRETKNFILVKTWSLTRYKHGKLRKMTSNSMMTVIVYKLRNQLTYDCYDWKWEDLTKTFDFDWTYDFTSSWNDITCFERASFRVAL